MAFTFDTKKDVGESVSSPVTDTYTVATDGFLIVHISVDSSGTPRAGGAPTFDGQALTQVTGSPQYSGNEGYAELWYHLAPTTGGTPTLSVPNTGELNIHVKISSYVSALGGSALGSEAAANGTSNTPACTPGAPGADGAVFVDSLFSDDRDDPTANNRTLLFEADTGSEANACQYYEQASDAAVLMEYTVARSDQWAIVAASFIEVAGASTAAVVPVATTFTVTSTTATHAQVVAAAVAPVATTLAPTATTATYIQIETAAVSPVAITLTPTATTATHESIAAVVPVALTLAVTATTGVGSTGQTAAVSPVTLTLTVTSATATYIQVETASVSPISVTITTTAATTTYVQVGVATIAPIISTLVATSTTATYIQVETSSVAPLALLLTIPAVTTIYIQVGTAAVSPATLALSVTATTASGSAAQISSVSPLPLTLALPATTATYIQAEAAAVVIIAMVLAATNTIASMPGAGYKVIVCYDSGDILIGL